MMRKKADTEFLVREFDVGICLVVLVVFDWIYCKCVCVCSRCVSYSMSLCCVGGNVCACVVVAP